jgi:hypothetical protein
LYKKCKKGTLRKKVIIPPLPEGGGGYTVLPLFNFCGTDLTAKYCRN